LNIGITILNIVSVQKENKKKMFSELVVKQRLKELNISRSLFSEFLAFVDCEVLNTMSYNFDNVKLISGAYYRINQELKKEYEIDKKIMFLLDSVYKDAVKILKKKDVDTEIFELKKVELSNLIYAYTSSNWSCIKAQSNGKEIFPDSFNMFFQEKIKDIN